MYRRLMRLPPQPNRISPEVALSHSRLRRDGLLATDDAADASDGGIGATEPRNAAGEVGVTHFRQKWTFSRCQHELLEVVPKTNQLQVRLLLVFIVQSIFEFFVFNAKKSNKKHPDNAGLEPITFYSKANAQPPLCWPSKLRPASAEKSLLARPMSKKRLALHFSEKYSLKHDRDKMRLTSFRETRIVGRLIWVMTKKKKKTSLTSFSSLPKLFKTKIIRFQGGGDQALSSVGSPSGGHELSDDL